MDGVTPKQITIGLTGLTILFLVSYIYFASTLTSLGYALDGRVRESARLVELENEFTLELARRQNPEYLAQEGKALKLVEIETISSYIDARVSALGSINTAVNNQ